MCARQDASSQPISRSYADVKDETIKLTDTELHFKGTSEGKPYEVNIEFFKGVNAEGSTYKTLPRSVQMHIMKKDKKDQGSDEEKYWPRLLKDKTLEKNQVKVDWNRYVDEDEEKEGFDTSALEGGMGMGGMPGMPGMGGGGMPGMGGPGGMDMEALMKQMGSMGGGGSMPGMGDMGDMGGDDDDDADDSDNDLDDMPDLEES